MSPFVTLPAVVAGGYAGGLIGERAKNWLFKQVPIYRKPPELNDLPTPFTGMA
jgi:hypothetical protein